jgi:hypothetical protein
LAGAMQAVAQSKTHQTGAIHSRGHFLCPRGTGWAAHANVGPPCPGMIRV